MVYWILPKVIPLYAFLTASVCENRTTLYAPFRHPRDRTKAGHPAFNMPTALAQTEKGMAMSDFGKSAIQRITDYVCGIQPSHPPPSGGVKGCQKEFRQGVLA